MYRPARTVVLLLVALLVVFGLVMLYSTSFATFSDPQEKLRKQLYWIVMAAIAAFALRKIDYHFFCRNSHILVLLISCALGYLAFAHLLYKLPFVPRAVVSHIPFTGGIKGAFRWLILGPIRIQPSEFAKIAIILFLAHYFGRNSRHVLEFFRGFILPMALAGAVILLVLLGGSLSVTIITGGVVFVLAFVAGVRARYLVLVIATGLILFSSVILISPTRMSRFTSFLNPEQVQEGDGYQLWHSLLALGSGGWHGVGFTQSRMKKFYLPEAHTDFIVSIVGEELGFAWVGLLILAYLLLTFSIFWVSGQAMDREGSLICAGVGASLGLHAFVNLAVVSGMLPTTGVTAPFVSYGGSSILASGIGIGLVLSVSKFTELAQQERHQQQTADAFWTPSPPPRKLFV